MTTADLPESIRLATQALFDALPLDLAMHDLLPSGVNLEHHPLARSAVEALGGYPGLDALIWLYVDDLKASHEISQNFKTPIGCYLHGIMHRREGDFWNAKYWLRQIGEQPFYLESYEPSRFVDQVEFAGRTNPPNLVSLQRQEWAALFRHVARASQD